MFKGSFFIVFVLAITSCFSQEFYPLELAQKYVRIALKDKNIVLEELDETAQVVSSASFLIKPFVIYKYIHTEPRVNGFIVFTQAKGRYEMFDYFVVINEKPEIEKVKVLKYRSEHGGEIASKKWLSQFENYSGGVLKYGSDISALSGATISAGSITADIQKVLLIIENYCKRTSSIK